LLDGEEFSEPAPCWFCWKNTLPRALLGRGFFICSMVRNFPSPRRVGFVGRTRCRVLYWAGLFYLLQTHLTQDLEDQKNFTTDRAESTDFGLEIQVGKRSEATHDTVPGRGAP
jgi:hypothetical protein